MGVLFGAMFICDSCGKDQFVKQGDNAVGWNFRDQKILCSACSREYEEKRKETKEND